MARLCLVVADAARARIYSITAAEGDRRRGVQFIERADLVNLERQRELEVDRRFAVDIGAATRAAVHAAGTGRVVLIASSSMLGPLRRTLGLDRAITVEQYALDLTRLTTPELHTRLTELGVLPAPVRAAG